MKSLIAKHFRSGHPQSEQNMYWSQGIFVVVIKHMIKCNSYIYDVTLQTPPKLVKTSTEQLNKQRKRTRKYSKKKTA